VGWVNYLRRFGHVEALRKMGTEMPERVSKTFTFPIV